MRRLVLLAAGGQKMGEQGLQEREALRRDRARGVIGRRCTAGHFDLLSRGLQWRG
jgi:hypothetical protein